MFLKSIFLNENCLKFKLFRIFTECSLEVAMSLNGTNCILINKYSIASFRMISIGLELQIDLCKLTGSKLELI